jgi:putative membrane protein insertion efficiency factor
MTEGFSTMGQPGAVARLRRVLWLAGWPARFVLLSAVRLYRATLGPAVGARCRFYPSCSGYAERAIADQGAVRGLALAAWRVVRCSPLSKGGVDHPPAKRHLYDIDIQCGIGDRSPIPDARALTERMPA